MFKKLLIIAALLCSTPAAASDASSMVAALQNRHTIERQTACLAINIYHEARGSTRQDQIAVGWVTRNRVTDRGTDYCRVIWEPRQFSWTVRSVRSLIPRELDAWHRSVDVANQVINGTVADPTNGARNFRLASSSRRGLRIGAHVYF